MHARNVVGGDEHFSFNNGLKGQMLMLMGLVVVQYFRTWPRRSQHYTSHHGGSSVTVIVMILGTVMVVMRGKVIMKTRDITQVPDC